MPDRSDEFRKVASDYLLLAHTRSDENSSAALLLMAQNGSILRTGHRVSLALRPAIQEFNGRQMEPKPVMQQQPQQTQLNKE